MSILKRTTKPPCYEAENYISRIRSSRSSIKIEKPGRPIGDLKYMLETSAEIYGDRPAFWQKFEKGGEYIPISYNHTLSDVNALGTALLSRGMKGKKIGVIGENSYFWAISYLAVVCGVGVVVPLDKELDKEELTQLIDEAEVSAVLLSGKYREIFSDISARENCSIEFLIDISAGKSEGRILGFDDVIEEGSRLIAMGNRDFIDAKIDRHELNILLFTSGTTGVAKGVMLSHWNICADLMSLSVTLTSWEDDIYFSLLPLHHTYECTCGMLGALYKGSSVAYCEGLKYVQKNMQEIRPTVFLGVPLIFETLYNSILKAAAKTGKGNALQTVTRANRYTSKLGIDLSKAFLKEIKKAFGGRMKFLVCGGAAGRPDILDFFCDMGFTCVQGYGLTECAPLVAVSPGKRRLIRNESVGHPLELIDAKIINLNDEGVGEICIKGENIMLGYYNKPEETAKCLIDGWFHTGDLGYIDRHGYIYITGRQKNVIITDNGKNVYPEELENYLLGSQFISECMVWARDDERGHNSSIVATVRVDKEALTEELGDDAEDIEAVLKLLGREVDRINAPQPLFKRINEVLLREAEFDKTTAMKIRRFSESNKDGIGLKDFKREEKERRIREKAEIKAQKAEEKRRLREEVKKAKARAKEIKRRANEAIKAVKEQIKRMRKGD